MGLKGRTRERNPHWKGGRYIANGGYVFLYEPAHPNAQSNGYVMEHVAVAARALGRPLTQGIVVHHIDEDRANNAPSNLVVCDRPYHNLIHQRMRLVALGVSYRTHRSCTDCGAAPHESFGGHKQRCKPCHSRYERERRARKAAA